MLFIQLIRDGLLLRTNDCNCIFRKDDGKTFDNLAFIQMNAAKLDADWTDKYDLVLIFDACHDQTRPDLVS